MAQTPQQRRANAKFDKVNEKKMGKPVAVHKKKEKPKSPISPVWLGLLIFVVLAPLVFEYFRLVPEVWKMFTNILKSVGIMSN